MADIKHKNKYDFDTIWQLDTDWFEPPNHRRGGWSGVVKYVLETTHGAIDVFIKRQENHVSKTLLHPFKGQMSRAPILGQRSSKG